MPPSPQLQEYSLKTLPPHQVNNGMVVESWTLPLPQHPRLLMHLPLFSSLRNRGTLALLIKIAPLMRVAAPVPNPVSVSSLSTAPAPMSTQLWIRLMIVKPRGMLHMPCIIPSTPSITGRIRLISAWAQLRFSSTPYSHTTSEWNYGKGYPPLSGGNTPKGKRKLSDIHRTTTQPQHSSL